ncbi:UbiD family decarboxylase [Pontibacter sp. G13]|uniref:UbiD family decarboxylase n=1 Tax=Pontibacter sp. G13 TaxID=3074898 RepID=UPI00288B65A4|nr:UbiD family decarboxylase [Pontibacter sp. G13]WNJ20692.1 UbiD family decarboxylase [Pontibacter sp. G13]
MRYASLSECVRDLERNGHLVRISQPVDPYLEIAEIQRRAYEQKAPAILFEQVKGSAFPAVCNLFGTMERSHFIFRSTIDQVKKIVKLKADPTAVLKAPHKYLGTPFAAVKAFPMKSRFGAPILHGTTSMDQLPQVTSWPMDGGPYVTLPQVYSEDPHKPGAMNSNMGMYRIQMAGNEYEPNREIGLHYQIHRGIGVHHTHAGERGEPLKVSIFVGGPPAHTFAAVMPLPEGLSELMFAGLFAGRNFRYVRKNGHTLSSDADFCIVGTIDPKATKPEGPFGDHLGYYSLTHEFPVMKVDAVYHRKDAIWPFTVVGRPPQEDTSFGELIHEVTADMVPVSVPGLKAMHAVDAAGVHPLLLAIGNERYVPYREREPQELLTVANAVLGFGQASLAKYLIIAAHQDRPDLDIHDISGFLDHVLRRVDWRRDLHFQTKTTIDTLDYSGEGLNQGSKVVIAAAGSEKRDLATELPEHFRLPDGFGEPRFAQPGMLMIQAPPFENAQDARAQAEKLARSLDDMPGLEEIPLIVLVDDSAFAAAKLNNFLWVTFTRSNPSHDIYGVRSFTEFKHWGCAGPLVIDARIKPHHAPPLVEDPKVTQRVNEMCATGGPLHGIIE